MKVLKEVVDLEVGINIVDLGLVYEIDVKGEKVNVKMTLTSPFCPLAGFIVKEVKNKIKSIDGDAEVEITFEPPWSPERMSKEAKEKLGIV